MPIYKIMLANQNRPNVYTFLQENGEDVVYDTVQELEDGIRELLLTIPANRIKPIESLEYVVDVIVNA